MMIDKLVIRVPGRVIGGGRNADEVGEQFDRYRQMLIKRAGADDSWPAPRSQGPARLSIRRPAEGHATTIKGAALNAYWARDHIDLSLTITVNPTRTLVHRVAELNGPIAPADLCALSPEAFFSPSSRAAPAETFDGNDNAIGNMDEVRAMLGPDFYPTYLASFEAQLRDWALEGMAPKLAGYAHHLEGVIPYGRSSEEDIALKWSEVVVTSAEVYFERRHHDAVGLLDRLHNLISKADAFSEWRRWGEQQIGSRTTGSLTVGLALTKTIHLAIYAKTRDRVRIEVRFLRHVRNAVHRVASRDGSSLAAFLDQLRAEALNRWNRWELFCAMCEERPQPLPPDRDKLIEIIGDCARQAGVSLGDLLGALRSGGIDYAGQAGRWPRRLLNALLRAEIVTGERIGRQRSPRGQPRRYAVTPRVAAILAHLNL